MGKIILTTILTTAFGVMFTGCGESEDCLLYTSDAADEL